jgi:uncharacterized protein
VQRSRAASDPQSEFQRSRRHRPSNFSVYFSLFLLAVLASGCKHEPRARLSPAEVHAITRDMAQASANFAKKPGSIGSRLQFDGKHPDRADQLFVTMPAGASEQARRESVAQLIQTLDGVATSNNLTRDPETSSGALLRLDYRSAGTITQSVHIVAPVATAAASAAPAPREKSHGAHGPARLAIILDDLGSDRAAADAIFALPYHLTISILPNHPHSTEIAQEAHRRGYEVMLHLPMQSVGNETPEAQELHPGMPVDEIPPLFEEMMQSVPGASGVNNHQGSQATADSTLMGELMPVLQSWNLFYIDSRTTAATVAYDTAQRDGVRSAFRNVPFLDDIAEVSAVRKQLQLALKGAQDKGEAIAIGHPHAATLQALREVLPQAKSRGIQLVYASDLVH